MSEIDKATPLPWRVGSRQFILHPCHWSAAIVAFDENGISKVVAETSIADAPLLLRAVNRDHLFDEMVQALEDSRSRLLGYDADVSIINAALAKAKGATS